MSSNFADQKDSSSPSDPNPTLPPPAVSKEAEQLARTGSYAPWSSWSDLKRYVMQDVNPSLCTTPLAAYCFMTGFM